MCFAAVFFSIFSPFLHDCAPWEETPGSSGKLPPSTGTPRRGAPRGEIYPQKQPTGTEVKKKPEDGKRNRGGGGGGVLWHGRALRWNRVKMWPQLFPPARCQRGPGSRGRGGGSRLRPTTGNPPRHYPNPVPHRSRPLHPPCVVPKSPVSSRVPSRVPSTIPRQEPRTRGPSLRLPAPGLVPAVTGGAAPRTGPP